MCQQRPQSLGIALVMIGIVRQLRYAQLLTDAPNHRRGQARRKVVQRYRNGKGRLRR